MTNLNGLFFGVFKRFRFAAAWLLVAALLLSMAPIQAYANETRNLYVVTVKPGTDVAMRKAIAALGESPIDELDFVLDGFTLSLTDADAAALELNPNVLEVALDEGVSLFETKSETTLWGLDRIDQLASISDGFYSYPDSAGANVRIYVVDTGVQADNPEFTGRVLPGFDATKSTEPTVDCHGHGTHVAGTAAGTSYGVARKASIVPVKVLDCSGRGTMTGIVSALDWIMANHPKGIPAVLNMSLGGGRYAPLNAAIERLSSAGIVSVAAAGNNNSDSCDFSPSSSPTAITVGASNKLDTRAYFSNFGPCVDVFAPGTEITSADAFNPKGTKTWQGTSMASPHVAGLAALYLSENPTASIAAVTDAIQKGGIAKQISNAASPAGNILVNNGFTRGLPNPPANPNPIFDAPDLPTGLIVSGVTSSSITATWTPPANNGGMPITGYRLYFRPTGTSSFSFTGASPTASQTITGLFGGTQYDLKVSAYNALGASLFTEVITATTLAGLPSAPFTLSTSPGSTSVLLTWTPPKYSGGSNVTGYRVEQLIGSTWQSLGVQSSLSRQVTGLQPSTFYNFRVFAINALGVSPTSIGSTFATFAISNSEILNVGVSAVTSTNATFTWDQVAPPVGASVSYVVKVKQVGSTTDLQYAAFIPPFSLANLRAGTSYSVEVAAQIGSQLGRFSPALVFTTATVIPSAPQAVRTALTSGVYSLTWGAPAVGNPIASYQVQSLDASGSWVDFAEATTTSIALPRLVPGQLYTFRVIARNAAGSGPASSTTQIRGPIAAPGQPVNLVATVIAGSRVSLTWQPPLIVGDAPITSYMVKVSRDSKNWLNLSTVTGTSFVTAQPTKGQTWTYKVAARNLGGIGLESDAASVAIASTKPGSVAGRATFVDTGLTRLSWYAPADTGGEVITGYRVESLAGTVWSTLDELPATTTSITVEKTGPGTSQSFRVFAKNALGEALTTATISISVPALQATAPLNFKAEKVANTAQVKMNWEPPVNLGGSALRSYLVQSSIDGKTWVSKASFASALTTSMPQTRGQVVQYRVLATTSAGIGLPSELATIDMPKIAPTSARSLSVKQLADKSLTISWITASDWGGGSSRSFSVEKLENGAWAQIASASEAPKSVFVSVPLSAQAPGAVLNLRVIATSEVGSAVPIFFNYTVPYLQASAPQSMSLAKSSVKGRLNLTWSSPADLGGGSVGNYYVYEKSGVTQTFRLVALLSGTVTKLERIEPAKGQAISFYVKARTGFGLGLESAVVSYIAP